MTMVMAEQAMSKQATVSAAAVLAIVVAGSSTIARYQDHAIHTDRCVAIRRILRSSFHSADQQRHSGDQCELHSLGLRKTDIQKACIQTYTTDEALTELRSGIISAQTKTAATDGRIRP